MFSTTAKPCKSPSKLSPTKLGTSNSPLKPKVEPMISSSPPKSARLPDGPPKSKIHLRAVNHRARKAAATRQRLQEVLNLKEIEKEIEEVERTLLEKQRAYRRLLRTCIFHLLSKC
ncbi:hypothetical protein CVT26_004622 [Gymnopilus dilepis]|uniref:Uncharacterized protein n=1 Tax=Gymnopilus dilepis TaxID=231916 RepID=A0A409YTJ4_9AGAR|nr:hypothetical protein CVT26_004622 [Gymnopilus dilepis]